MGSKLARMDSDVSGTWKPYGNSLLAIVPSFLLIAVIFALTSDASATPVTEDISTHMIWASINNPWSIKNDIRVLDGASLTLRAGVNVEFDGRYSITCHGSGKVVIDGRADNMVHVTSASPSSFNYSSFEIGIAGVVRNCTFSYGAVCLVMNEASSIEETYVANAPEGIRVIGGNVELRRCTVSDCDTGILFVGSSQNLMLECNISTCVKGVLLDGSTGYTTIEGCDVRDCDVRAVEIKAAGKGIRVLNSTVSYSRGGIFVWGAQDVLIENIMAIECETGIGIASASTSSAEPIWIEHCRARKCHVGIGFTSGGKWTYVTNTTIELNDMGADRRTSDYHEVFFWRNNFLWNNIQVTPTTMNTSWSLDGTGNFWSDYDGADGDGDGIGDTPYDVTPTQQDPFPLMEPVDFEAPVAAAGKDVTVRQHGTFKLDGSGSRDDTWIADWAWTVDVPGEPLVLRGPVVEAVAHVAGAFDVTLVVTDAVGRTGSDVLRLTVTDADPPEFLSIDVPGTVSTGGVLNISCRARDNVAVTGVHVQYAYGGGSLNDRDLFNLGGGLWSTDIAVPPDLGEPIHYILTARDAARNVNTTGYLSVEVVDDVPPVLAPDLPEFATTGEGAFCCCTVTDNVGVARVTLEYAFPGRGAMLVNLTGVGTSWSALVQVPADAPSPMTVRFTAEDRSGNTATTGPLEVVIRDDDPPTMGEVRASPPVDAWHRNGTVTVTAVLADNRGVATAALDVMYPATGWTPVPMVAAGGAYCVTFTVAPDLGARLVFRLNVTDAAGNRLLGPEVEVGLLSQDPRILSEPATEVLDGHPYVVKLVAEDPDTAATSLWWRLETNATWLRLDSNAMRLAGTPSGGDVGRYWVNVSVTDGEGGAAHLRWEVEVRDFNWPPVVTIIAPDEGFRASGWLTVTARVDDDDGVVEWVRLRVDDGEWTDMEGPTLWSLNLEAGELSKGSHTVSVKAFDGVSESEVRTLNFTAPGSGGGRLPAIAIVGPAVGVLVAVAVALVYARARRRRGSVSL